MSVVKFNPDQWSKILGALTSMFRNGCGGWSNPIRDAVVYSDRAQHDFAHERMHDEHQMPDPEKPQKTMEAVAERSLRWAVNSWRIANAVAYAVQYDKPFDPTQEVDDEHPSLSLVGLKWLSSELHSVRYNLATNGGRIFCPSDDLDLLSDIINAIDAHRLRDHEEGERKRREEAGAQAKNEAKAEEERRAKINARREAKNADRDGSVAP